MRKILFVVAAFALAECYALKPEELVACPVSENLRGHENVEWSIGYSYGMTDPVKLPRVLLVGDSICNGYQAQVRELLANKMKVSYWVSSYCVTSPGYLRLLSFYLDEAEYDVIHFNNGLHSLTTPTEDWSKGLEAALKLISLKQPKAKIVWTSSTALKNPSLTAKSKELNEAAKKVIAKFGEVPVDDLFAVTDPLDRETMWSDTFHFKAPVREMLAKKVADFCLKAVGK